MPLGLGSGHIAAANRSAVTKAVCIVVSESSVVRLFCQGQLVGELTILTPSLRQTPIAK
jgi:DNA integrity scanning protein DisA with diadenylate cyclase activity